MQDASSWTMSVGPLTGSCQGIRWIGGLGDKGVPCVIIKVQLTSSASSSLSQHASVSVPAPATLPPCPCPSPCYTVILNSNVVAAAVALACVGHDPDGVYVGVTRGCSVL